MLVVFATLGGYTRTRKRRILRSVMSKDSRWLKETRGVVRFEF